MAIDFSPSTSPAAGREPDVQKVLEMLKQNEVSEEILQHRLRTFVEEADMEQVRNVR